MKSLEELFARTQPKVLINCPEKEGFLYRLDHSWNHDLEMKAFRIIKRTEKGVWIELGPVLKNKKYVLLTARKKWACPTHKEAIISFQRRREFQISLLKSQLDEAERQLNMINKFIQKNLPEES